MVTLTNVCCKMGWTTIELLMVSILRIMCITGNWNWKTFLLYSNHRSRCFQDVNSTTGWKGLIEQKNNNVRVQTNCYVFEEYTNIIVTMLLTDVVRSIRYNNVLKNNFTKIFCIFFLFEIIRDITNKFFVQ